MMRAFALNLQLLPHAACGRQRSAGQTAAAELAAEPAAEAAAANEVIKLRTPGDPNDLRRRRRRRRLVRHSHRGPSIMLICSLMLRHLNKNCVISMQQQQQPFSLISVWQTIVVRAVERFWWAQFSCNFQRCLHLSLLVHLLAQLICVNRVSYASTIMKTLLTCILVQLCAEPYHCAVSAALVVVSCRS